MDETMMEQAGNTQDKVQGLNIVMNGITINGPMFDIHDNHHVVINATSSSQGEVNGSAMSAAPSPRERAGGEAPFDDVIKAAEACQSYFWAQSSWAVVYCVCRNHLEMEMSMSEFERRVADYPLSPKTKPCPEGTIRAAFSDNDYLHYSIHRWSEGRSKALAEALIEKLR